MLFRSFIKTHFDAYKVVEMAAYNTVRDECVSIKFGLIV